MAIVKDDKYYKGKGDKFYADSKSKAINTSNDLYDGQVESTNKDYDTQVFEAGRAYEDQYRDNAVQKAINERQVAESMANLGLRDSGLNRTQQTAVQLSHANNNASIDRQKQGQIDSLELARRQTLDSIEQNRIASNAQIDQDYDNLALQYGNSLKAEDEAKVTEYKNLVYSFVQSGIMPSDDIIALAGLEKSDVKAIYKNYKKLLGSSSVTSSGSGSGGGGNGGSKYSNELSGIIFNNGSNLYLDMQGTLKDNNITMTAIVKDGKTTGYKYVDNNTGKSTTFSVGVNPFTGTNNADITLGTDTTKAFEQYGAFENGYQPKGIFYGGEDYGWVMESGIKDYINGNLQNVHKTSDGSLWIWDRKQNKYRSYEQ